MAKDDIDLSEFEDLDEDLDFEDMGSLDDDPFADSIDSPDGNSRTPTGSALKQTYNATVDEIRNKRIIDHANGIITESLSDEGKYALNDVKFAADDIIEGVNQAFDPLKKQVDTVAGLLKKTVGEDSWLGNKLTSLQEFLDVEKSSGANNTTDPLEEFNQNMSGMFGGIESSIASLRQQLESNKQNANMGAKLNELVYQNKYSVELQKIYYQNHLKLAFEHLYVSKQTHSVLKDQFAALTKLLDTIVHNTSLPDAVKINTKEAMYAMARNKASTAVINGIFGKGKDVLTNIGKNIQSKVAEKLSPVQSGLEGAQAGLEMINDMSDNGISLAEMAGSMIADKILQMGYKGLTTFVPEKFKNKLDFNLQNLVNDPESFFKNSKIISSKDNVFYKLYNKLTGGLADLTKSSNIVEADKLKIGTYGNDSAAVFDGRTHNTINTVIPKYLSEILAEMTAMRVGWGYNPIGNEYKLRWDDETSRLTTTANIERNIISKFGKQAIESNKNIDTIITKIAKYTENDIFLDSETGEQLDVEGVFKELPNVFHTFLQKSNGKITIYDLKDKKFISLFPEKLQKTAFTYFNGLFEQLERDPSTVNEMFSLLKRAVATYNVPTQMLRNYSYQNRDILQDLNLVTFDTEGQGNFSKEGYFKSLNKGLNIDIEEINKRKLSKEMSEHYKNNSATNDDDSFWDIIKLDGFDGDWKEKLKKYGKDAKYAIGNQVFKAKELIALDKAGYIHGNTKITLKNEKGKDEEVYGRTNSLGGIHIRRTDSKGLYSYKNLSKDEYWELGDFVNDTNNELASLRAKEKNGETLTEEEQNKRDLLLTASYEAYKKLHGDKDSWSLKKLITSAKNKLNDIKDGKSATVNKLDEVIVNLFGNEKRDIIYNALGKTYEAGKDVLVSTDKAIGASEKIKEGGEKLVSGINSGTEVGSNLLAAMGSDNEETRQLSDQIFSLITKEFKENIIDGIGAINKSYADIKELVQANSAKDLAGTMLKEFQSGFNNINNTLKNLGENIKVNLSDDTKNYFNQIGEMLNKTATTLESKVLSLGVDTSSLNETIANLKNIVPTTLLTDLTKSVNEFKDFVEKAQTIDGLKQNLSTPEQRENAVKLFVTLETLLLQSTPKEEDKKQLHENIINLIQNTDLGKTIINSNEYKIIIEKGVTDENVEKLINKFSSSITKALDEFKNKLENNLKEQTKKSDDINQKVTDDKTTPNELKDLLTKLATRLNQEHTSKVINKTFNKNYNGHKYQTNNIFSEENFFENIQNVLSTNVQNNQKYSQDLYNNVNVNKNKYYNINKIQQVNELKNRAILEEIPNLLSGILNTLNSMSNNKGVININKKILKRSGNYRKRLRQYKIVEDDIIFTGEVSSEEKQDNKYTEEKATEQIENKPVEKQEEIITVTESFEVPDEITIDKDKNIPNESIVKQSKYSGNSNFKLEDIIGFNKNGKRKNKKKKEQTKKSDDINQKVTDDKTTPNENKTDNETKAETNITTGIEKLDNELKELQENKKDEIKKTGYLVKGINFFASNIPGGMFISNAFKNTKEFFKSISEDEKVIEDIQEDNTKILKDNPEVAEKIGESLAHINGKETNLTEEEKKKVDEIAKPTEAELLAAAKEAGVKNLVDDKGNINIDALNIFSAVYIIRKLIFSSLWGLVKLPFKLRKYTKGLDKWLAKGLFKTVGMALKLPFQLAAGLLLPEKMLVKLMNKKQKKDLEKAVEKESKKKGNENKTKEQIEKEVLEKQRKSILNRGFGKLANLARRLDNLEIQRKMDEKIGKKETTLNNILNFHSALTGKGKSAVTLIDKFNGLPLEEQKKYLNEAKDEFIKSKMAEGRSELEAMKYWYEYLEKCTNNGVTEIDIARQYYITKNGKLTGTIREKMDEAKSLIEKVNYFRKEMDNKTPSDMSLYELVKGGITGKHNISAPVVAALATKKLVRGGIKGIIKAPWKLRNLEPIKKTRELSNKLIIGGLKNAYKVPKMAASALIAPFLPDSLLTKLATNQHKGIFKTPKAIAEWAKERYDKHLYNPGMEKDWGDLTYEEKEIWAENFKQAFIDNRVKQGKTKEEAALAYEKERTEWVNANKDKEPIDYAKMMYERYRYKNAFFKVLDYGRKFLKTVGRGINNKILNPVKKWAKDKVNKAKEKIKKALLTKSWYSLTPAEKAKLIDQYKTEYIKRKAKEYPGLEMEGLEADYRQHIKDHVERFGSEDKYFCYLYDKGELGKPLPNIIGKALDNIIKNKEKWKNKIKQLPSELKEKSKSFFGNQADKFKYKYLRRKGVVYGDIRDLDEDEANFFLQNSKIYKRDELKGDKVFSTLNNRMKYIEEKRKLDEKIKNSNMSPAERMKAEYELEEKYGRHKEVNDDIYDIKKIRKNERELHNSYALLRGVGIEQVKDRSDLSKEEKEKHINNFVKETLAKDGFDSDLYKKLYRKETDTFDNNLNTDILDKADKHIEIKHKLRKEAFIKDLERSDLTDKEKHIKLLKFEEELSKEREDKINKLTKLRANKSFNTVGTIRNNTAPIIKTNEGESLRLQHEATFEKMRHSPEALAAKALQARESLPDKLRAILPKDDKLDEKVMSLQTQYDTFKNGYKDVPEHILVKSFLRSVKKQAGNKNSWWNRLKTKAKEITNKVKEKGKGILSKAFSFDNLLALGTGGLIFYLKNSLEGLPKYIMSAFSIMTDKLTKIIMAPAKWLGEKFISIFNKLNEMFNITDKVKNVGKTILDVGKGAYETVKNSTVGKYIGKGFDFVKGIGSKVGEYGTLAYKWVASKSQMISKYGPKIYNFAKTLLTKVGGAKGLFKTIITKLFKGIKLGGRLAAGISRALSKLVPGLGWALLAWDLCGTAYDILVNKMGFWRALIKNFTGFDLLGGEEVVDEETGQVYKPDLNNLPDEADENSDKAKSELKAMETQADNISNNIESVNNEKAAVKTNIKQVEAEIASKDEDFNQLEKQFIEAWGMLPITSRNLKINIKAYLETITNDPTSLQPIDILVGEYTPSPYRETEGVYNIGFGGFYWSPWTNTCYRTYKQMPKTLNGYKEDDVVLNASNAIFTKDIHVCDITKLSLSKNTLVWINAIKQRIMRTIITIVKNKNPNKWEEAMLKKFNGMKDQSNDKMLKENHTKDDGKDVKENNNTNTRFVTTETKVKDLTSKDKNEFKDIIRLDQKSGEDEGVTETFSTDDIDLTTSDGKSPLPKDQAEKLFSWGKGESYDKFKQLYPQFQYELADFAKDYIEVTGHKPLITSTVRTYQEQKRFWDNYQRTGSPKAARPGGSKHNWGMAVDIDSKSEASLLARKKGIYAKHGLVNTVSGEPWHWEPKWNQSKIYDPVVGYNRPMREALGSTIWERKGIKEAKGVWKTIDEAKAGIIKAPVKVVDHSNKFNNVKVADNAKPNINNNVVAKVNKVNNNSSDIKPTIFNGVGIGIGTDNNMIKNTTNFSNELPNPEKQLRQLEENNKIAKENKATQNKQDNKMVAQNDSIINNTAKQNDILTQLLSEMKNMNDKFEKRDKLAETRVQNQRTGDNLAEVKNNEIEKKNREPKIVPKEDLPFSLKREYAV